MLGLHVCNFTILSAHFTRTCWRKGQSGRFPRRRRICMRRCTGLLHPPPLSSPASSQGALRQDPRARPLGAGLCPATAPSIRCGRWPGTCTGSNGQDHPQWPPWVRAGPGMAASRCKQGGKGCATSSSRRCHPSSLSFTLWAVHSQVCVPAPHSSLPLVVTQGIGTTV